MLLFNHTLEVCLELPGTAAKTPDAMQFAGGIFFICVKNSLNFQSPPLGRESVELSVGLWDGVCVEVTLGVWLNEGVMVGLMVWVAVRDEVVVRVGEMETVGETVGVAVGVGVEVPNPEGPKVGVCKQRVNLEFCR